MPIPLFFILFIALISCYVPKNTRLSDNEKIATRLVALAPIVISEYKSTTFSIRAHRVKNSKLKDSLDILNIYSLAIKYTKDTLHPLSLQEYTYGNNTLLPDSCIIFSNSENDGRQERSTMVFYFFGKTKPKDFIFKTYKPIKEKTTKINDSTWTYKSIHQLITTS
jgi:hypothetical protein